MATELRWILAALSALLLGGIWWWGARRARRSPEALQAHSAEPEIRTRDPGASMRSRDYGVPPFEPLSVRTADFEEVHITDLPMTVHPDSIDEALEAADIRDGSALDGPELPPAEPPPLETAGTAKGHNAPARDVERIVSLRVAADGASRWPGARLLAALHEHGLTHGRYQVFHRKHGDGRTLFCAASLVEPGTFDLSRMPQDEYRGVTLFAVLPGPADALYTFDAMLEAACGLAQSLAGTVQDADGTTISAERAVALREEVARAHPRNETG